MCANICAMCRSACVIIAFLLVNILGYRCSHTTYACKILTVCTQTVSYHPSVCEQKSLPVTLVGVNMYAIFFIYTWNLVSNVVEVLWVQGATLQPCGDVVPIHYSNNNGSSPRVIPLEHVIDVSSYKFV